MSLFSCNRLLAGAEAVFASGAKGTEPTEDKTAELCEQTGWLKVELDWVKKLPHSAEAKRGLIEPGHPGLSVRRLCVLLDRARSSLCYEPAPEGPENLGLMRLIDERCTRCPFYGSRRIKAWLGGAGHAANRKRVPLLGIMGLEAIYPKPKLSAGRGHKVYPYLLRSVTVERADHVPNSTFTARSWPGWSGTPRWRHRPRRSHQYRR